MKHVQLVVVTIAGNRLDMRLPREYVSPFALTAVIPVDVGPTSATLDWRKDQLINIG
jgi:hypothetical protein